MEQRLRAYSWRRGDRVVMMAGDGMVAPGTPGTVTRVYPEVDGLVVLFDGERYVCLVDMAAVAQCSARAEAPSRAHMVGGPTLSFRPGAEPS